MFNSQFSEVEFFFRSSFSEVLFQKFFYLAKELSMFDGNKNVRYRNLIGFGGLKAACWPLVPKFAGSNPAEAVGFFRAKKKS